MIFSLLVGLALAASDTMLPSEVVPGQKAYGLTVFVGDKVERFDLELVGVLDNFIGPKQDLVIAKITDPKLALAGVVAGMSGSPVFSADGRLIGALGYALGQFMKEGFCGITPIASMRKVRDLPTIDPFSVATREGTFSGMVRPIASPLSISGVDPSILAAFTPKFEALGFVTTPSGSMKTTGATKIEPGGAIAAALVTGDLSIAATGTVTTVDGNRVLAFGHPFLGAGAASYPMAAARIITIIPSLERSIKLAAQADIVGSFTQDRLTAIGGEIGKKADTVPVDVEIRVEPEGISHSYHYALARDLKLTPDLLSLVLANSFMRRTDGGLLGTAEVEATFALADGDSVSWQSRVVMDHEQSLPTLAAQSVARPAEVLWHNEFGPPLLAGVKVKATLRREIRGQRIELLTSRQTFYLPGETIHFRVGLRSDEKPLRFQEFEFTLPTGIGPGDYELHVSGAGDANGVEWKTGGLLRPQTAAGLVQALRSIRHDGPMYVQLVGNGANLRIGEALVSGAPLSFVEQSGPREGDGRTQRGSQSILLERSFDLKSFVFGGADLTVRVRAK